MLKQFLLDAPKINQDQIMSYMFMTKSKDILCLHFWSTVEYEQNLNIFRTTKEQYANRVQAFTSLWLMDYLIVEENLSSLNDEQTLQSISQKVFPDSIKKFHYKDIDTQNAFSYVKGQIERMQENILKSRKQYPLENYNIEFPSSIPGIFVNHRLIKESDFSFDYTFKIEKAIELFNDTTWAGYKTLFLETDKEYIYFTQ